MLFETKERAALLFLHLGKWGFFFHSLKITFLFVFLIKSLPKPPKTQNLGHGLCARPVPQVENPLTDKLIIGRLINLPLVLFLQDELQLKLPMWL